MEDKKPQQHLSLDNHPFSNKDKFLFWFVNGIDFLFRFTGVFSKMP